MRNGFSLFELVTAITVIGLLSVTAITRLAPWLDRAAVRRSGDELAAFYETARYAAIIRSTPVRVELEARALRALYEGVSDSLFLESDGPAAHGVALTASRVSVRVHPNGIGAGGANTKIVLQRGAAVESLTTSRVGRLRRWR